MNSTAESPEPNFDIQQCRPVEGKLNILSERRARDGDGASIWLCRCHREVVVAPVTYIGCNHCGHLSDGMGAGVNILQT